MDISMRTAYRLATSGKIPAKKVGGVWRVDPIKLDLYLKTEWDKNSGEY
jgi:excisionase family DNA binding protein